ncbi:unnamed protein product [Adineta ricciae]|uniref:Uncharacterized protein n=1 Tax=Adineta ricciae TaxID=249248 RepID=A0A814H787_ADIRI|nr:unnamed protein product [Adineta ricciae]
MKAELTLLEEDKRKKADCKDRTSHVSDEPRLLWHDNGDGKDEYENDDDSDDSDLEDFSTSDDNLLPMLIGIYFIFNSRLFLGTLESASLTPTAAIIFINDSNGLLYPAYLTRLNECLSQWSYSLIQPLFRSHKSPYGSHTIDDDIEVHFIEKIWS